MPNSDSFHFERNRFLSGTRIFREGESGSLAYLIEKGKVEISVGQGESRTIVSTLGEGEVFGEMALIDNLTRSASATALDDTFVMTLDRTQFEKRIHSADPVLHLLLRVILKRFRRSLRNEAENKLFGMTGEFTASGLNEAFNLAREAAMKQLRLESELGMALSGEQFILHYQPIVTSGDFNLCGFEALIRWQHPDRGLISPGEFITAAEGSNLIVPMGRWVIEQACHDLRRMHELQLPGETPLFMGVNVSSRQIQHLSTDHNLSTLLARGGVDPQDFKVEITESILIESPETAALSLKKIRDTGVKLAIDDFGTGYSSLSYLHQYPIDVLKIDQSFIQRMAEDQQSVQIVRAIVGLAHQLGMQVIAEGIENHDIAEQLAEMRCDLLQGYLVSQPVAIEQALDLINQPQSTASHG